MIRIKKPRQIPKRLKTKGKTETKKLKKLFDKSPAAYLDGAKKFSFKNNIYGHPSVKIILRKAQYDKCCFCERKTEIGDVEHFRGKGGYKQKSGDALQKPGYYWLAYEWDNLLFSCEKCNRSYKKNFFPITNTIHRAKSHHDNLKLETPLFIHPAKEDPRQFIEYNGAFPRAIGGNEKGKITIEKIGLDRPFLNDERLTHYQTFKLIFNLSQNNDLPDSKRKELLGIVEDASKNNAAYSSMIQCAIEQNFRF